MGMKTSQKVFLDTNCFIYLFEDHPVYADTLDVLFSRIQKREMTGLFSVITYHELLVKPKRDKNRFLENRYRLLVTNFPNLQMIPVSADIACLAASIRAETGIKTPDALILASALHDQASLFVSNDQKLATCAIQYGHRAVTMDDLSAFLKGRDTCFQAGYS